MSLIPFLQTCFYVCLACAILFFAVSIVLFFVFDIRTIFNFKTGRAKAKTIKAMMETYDRTGRLRGEDKSLGGGSGKNKSKKKKKKNRSGKGKKSDNAIFDRYSAKSVSSTENEPIAQPSQVQTEPTSYASQVRGAESGGEGTSLLYNANPTEVLRQVRVQPYNFGMSTTEQLSGTSNSAASVPAAAAVNAYGGANVHFKVVKKLVVVHTDEIIR